MIRYSPCKPLSGLGLKFLGQRDGFACYSGTFGLYINCAGRWWRAPRS